MPPRGASRKHARASHGSCSQLPPSFREPTSRGGAEVPKSKIRMICETSRRGVLYIHSYILPSSRGWRHRTTDCGRLLPPPQRKKSRPGSPGRPARVEERRPTPGITRLLRPNPRRCLRSRVILHLRRAESYRAEALPATFKQHPTPRLAYTARTMTGRNL